MEKDSFTPEEGRELVGVILAHVGKMADRALEALHLTVYANELVVTKAPWCLSEESKDKDPTVFADRNGEMYKQSLTALLAEDYKMPVGLADMQAMLFTGVSFYYNLLESREDFFIFEDFPQLLTVDERMSEIFLRVAMVSGNAESFVTNKARTKQTNNTRREGTDQDVLAAIEKLKAGDPEDRERYTKTGLAGAIFKALPGPLPTPRTIQYSLERLFFKQRGTTKRGERFSLHDLTE